MMKEGLRRVFAIASLTIKAAFRFRLAATLAIAVFGVVLLLPFFVKHDGTARMFAQVLLTYSLYSAICALGAATLWLGCGLHATDMEPGQLQLLAVKPACRWQIFMGRWLGIMTLNAALLIGVAASTYGIVSWRARTLAPEQQAVLKREILISRSSLRERAPNLEADVEVIIGRRFQEGSLDGVDLEMARREILDSVRARHETLPPNYKRAWDIDFAGRAAALGSQELQVRVRFQSARQDDDSLNKLVWIVGDPGSGRFWRQTTDLAAGIFHEFTVPGSFVGGDGKLHIECENRSGATLLFRLEDGLEVLFREGGFLANYARALVVILCWLALLSALTLTVSSFLSFGIAALFSLTLIVIGLSGDTFGQALAEGAALGRDDTGAAIRTSADSVILPIYRGARFLISPIDRFSPIESLSEGRLITWGQTGLAVFQIVFLAGGIVAAIGVVVFARRELAREIAQA